MLDMLSNELKAGDCVMVKYGTEWISGVIIKSQNGGLSLAMGKGQQAAQTADVLILQVTLPLAGIPGKPQPFVARLDVKNQVDDLVESSLKM